MINYKAENILIDTCDDIVDVSNILTVIGTNKIDKDFIQPNSNSSELYMNFLILHFPNLHKKYANRLRSCIKNQKNG